MTFPPGLLGARELRELLDRHGVRPSKALGQNFVMDPNTIRKVVAAAELAHTDVVLEIGAGGGSLTRGLAAAAARVIAIELDPHLVSALGESLSGLDNVEIIEGDALQIDYATVTADVMVANLPYNIAARVALKVLEDTPSIRRLTVMTQREVGERLAASPGSRIYGAPSALVSFYGTARILGPVSRHAFYPVPNVDSVLLAIARRERLPEVDRALFKAVVRAGFAQRRKAVRNSLGTVCGSPAVAELVLEDAGIPPTRRAEALSSDDFVALARALSARAT